VRRPIARQHFSKSERRTVRKRACNGGSKGKVERDTHHHSFPFLRGGFPFLRGLSPFLRHILSGAHLDADFWETFTDGGAISRSNEGGARGNWGERRRCANAHAPTPTPTHMHRKEGKKGTKGKGKQDEKQDEKQDGKHLRWAATTVPSLRSRTT
jgi:hypothetical protein